MSRVPAPLASHGSEPSSDPPCIAHHPPASEPPHRTLVGALEAAAVERDPLLTMHLGRQSTALDGRALLEGAWRFGRVLRWAGVRPGDPVPILLPTSTDFVHALLGTMMVGAIPAPLAHPMTFGGVERYVRNLAGVVEDAGARCLVTTARLREAAAVDPVLSKRITAVIVPEEGLAQAGSVGSVTHAVSPEDAALLQYTSGTTDRPKGVVISHRALTANANAIARGLRLDPAGDVGVSWLPLFHDMGLIGVLLTALCHPYPVHLLRPESFVMQPRRWLELICEVGGTVSAAPNFAYDLCTSRVKEPLGDVNLRSWRAALNGAEPVQLATLERFGARFSESSFDASAFLPVYGLAESTLAVAFPQVGDALQVCHLDRASIEPGGHVRMCSGAEALAVPSVGPPVEGTSVRIVHEGGGVPEAVLGEVQVAGPSLMDGYFHNEAASAEALQGGWLRTGDLGFLHQGKLYLVGRAKEVIIKGGRNYYPHDVERIAVAVTGGAGAAAAFAEQNATTGTEDLVVVVESRERDPDARARIANEVRGELLAVLGVKADQVLVCGFGGLPRTTSGKVRRVECRRLARAGELS
jgi:fatty-acyl-CoA synthase